MRRIVNLLATLAVAVLLVGVGVFCCYVANNYTRDAVVVSVKDGVTTFEDSAGWLWEYDTMDFRVDDEVVLYMNTNSTDTYFKDDIITKIEAQ